MGVQLVLHRRGHGAAPAQAQLRGSCTAQGQLRRSCIAQGQLQLRHSSGAAGAAQVQLRRSSGAAPAQAQLQLDPPRGHWRVRGGGLQAQLQLCLSSERGGLCSTWRGSWRPNTH